VRRCLLRLMLTKPAIARLRELREKKSREAAGQFVIEGEKVVAELLAAGFPLLEIYATPKWADPAARTPGPGGGVAAAPVRARRHPDHDR